MFYDKLVAKHPEVERKGKTTPYTSVNGNMFSFLDASGTVALRLPADAREKFFAKHPGAECTQHGRVMREYVSIPGAMLSKTATMKKLFDVSFEYASSLKPKATTRKKATEKKVPKKKVAKKKVGKTKRRYGK